MQGQPVITGSNTGKNDVFIKALKNGRCCQAPANAPQLTGGPCITYTELPTATVYTAVVALPQSNGKKVTRSKNGLFLVFSKIF
jgi:hypothetical protein